MDISYSSDEIYNIIRNEIISLKILPGEILTEKAFCERFHISRTPIRSALQRLQENHFIDIVPHRSTTVTKINLDNAMQLIYERVAVETMVLRDFIKTCSPTDVERVRYALHNLQEAGKQFDNPHTFDINHFLALDHDMHRIWFQAIGKEYLWQHITSPHPDYSRFIRLDILEANNVPDVIADHTKMMELIDTHDIEGIEPLIHHHLYGGVRRLGTELFSGEHQKYFHSLEQL